MRLRQQPVEYKIQVIETQLDSIIQKLDKGAPIPDLPHRLKKCLSAIRSVQRQFPQIAHSLFWHSDVRKQRKELMFRNFPKYRKLHPPKNQRRLKGESLRDEPTT